eukprot:7391272-Prymnesium_polylepis.1
MLLLLLTFPSSFHGAPPRLSRSARHARAAGRTRTPATLRATVVSPEARFSRSLSEKSVPEAVALLSDESLALSPTREQTAKLLNIACAGRDALPAAPAAEAPPVGDDGRPQRRSTAEAGGAVAVVDYQRRQQDELKA